MYVFIHIIHITIPVYIQHTCSCLTNFIDCDPGTSVNKRIRCAHIPVLKCQSMIDLLPYQINSILKQYKQLSGHSRSSPIQFQTVFKFQYLLKNLPILLANIKTL